MRDLFSATVPFTHERKITALLTITFRELKEGKEYGIAESWDEGTSAHVEIINDFETAITKYCKKLSDYSVDAWTVALGLKEAHDVQFKVKLPPWLRE